MIQCPRAALAGPAPALNDQALCGQLGTNAGSGTAAPC